MRWCTRSPRSSCRSTLTNSSWKKKLKCQIRLLQQSCKCWRRLNAVESHSSTVCLGIVARPTCRCFSTTFELTLLRGIAGPHCSRYCGPIVKLSWLWLGKMFRCDDCHLANFRWTLLWFKPLNPTRCHSTWCRFQRQRSQTTSQGLHNNSMVRSQRPQAGSRSSQRHTTKVGEKERPKEKARKPRTSCRRNFRTKDVSIKTTMVAGSVSISTWAGAKTQPMAPSAAKVFTCAWRKGATPHTLCWSMRSTRPTSLDTLVTSCRWPRRAWPYKSAWLLKFLLAAAESLHVWNNLGCKAVLVLTKSGTAIALRPLWQLTWPLLKVKNFSSHG